jgi:signal transduction histidine kinase
MRSGGWVLVAVIAAVTACAGTFCLALETWMLHKAVGGWDPTTLRALQGSRIFALIATALSIGIAGIAIRFAARAAHRGSFAPDDRNGPMADQISARLLTVQEEERKNLSRDLHDGIGQIVTALKMELARVKIADEDDAERLGRARAMTDEMLSTIRNISRLLRPTALDDLGLEAALLWHVEDFSRRSSIACELNCSLPQDQFLSEPLKTCVFRVVQEALNNCEKHASPRKVVVNLEQDDDTIRARISDDGVGFQHPVSEIRGLGLVGMWERAAMLGGGVEVESKPGKGTVVTLTLPLSQGRA